MKKFHGTKDTMTLHSELRHSDDVEQLMEENQSEFDLLSMAEYLNELLYKNQKKINEVGTVEVRLYDENFNQVQSFLLEKAEGIQNVSFSPDYKGKAAYIGFMANDELLLDYSTFETTVYSIAFNTVNNEGIALTYKMRDLTYWNSYNLDYEMMEDGSLFAKYDEIYAEIMFCFPEEIDMSKCSSVEARVQCEVGNLAIKLYDEAFNELNVHYNIKTNGVQTKVLNYSTEEKIYGIGIMTCDDSLTDYSQCVVKVESVTFYMLE